MAIFLPADKATVRTHLGGRTGNGNADKAGAPLDEPSELSKKFIVNVATTLNDLQQREDTDGDWQITIDDHGPKARARPPTTAGYADSGFR